MRIWQRSAMASTRPPEASVIRSCSVRVGTAAYRSARAPTQSKTRSATSRLRHELPRPGPDPGEEPGDPLPRLRAAVEALPVHPDRADQLVARVDRDQEALDAVAVVADQDRLDLRRRRGQQRVAGGQPGPRVQGEPAF